jgi:hypothetical protein
MRRLLLALFLAMAALPAVPKVWSEHCGQTIDETWAAAVPAQSK